jgi:hypothetical protein
MSGPSSSKRYRPKPTQRGSRLNSYGRITGARRPGTGAGKAPQHRDADDRRHRLERFRCLFGGRRGSRPSDTERRSDSQGGRRFHELVRPGELYGRPRLVLNGASADPLGALDRGCPGRREPSPKGDADDRRILPEERLHDVSPASGIWATSPTPIRPRTASTR